MSEALALAVPGGIGIAKFPAFREASPFEQRVPTKALQQPVIPLPRTAPVNSQPTARLREQTRQFRAPLTTPERLLVGSGELKTLMSRFAHALGDDAVQHVRSELDVLLDPQAWDSDDVLPRADSLQSLLRAWIYLRPTTQPSLAHASGNMIATWFERQARLSIEFYASDEVRWFFSGARRDGGRESTAGKTGVTELPRVLAPYQPERWFKS